MTNRPQIPHGVRQAMRQIKRQREEAALARLERDLQGMPEEHNQALLKAHALYTWKLIYPPSRVN